MKSKQGTNIIEGWQVFRAGINQFEIDFKCLIIIALMLGYEASFELVI